MSHYYTKDAKACHEVPNKSKPGTFRPTTSADARKLGLFPSVTTIDRDVYANWGIIEWQKSQVLLAALTLPLLPGESVDDYAARVIRDADAHMNKASDFGTRMHNCIELRLTQGIDATDDETRPFFMQVEHWLDENVEEIRWAERTMVCDTYGGTVDLFARLKGRDRWLIIDHKTRNPSKAGKLSIYDKDVRQLAAYRNMLLYNEPELPIPSCANLLIASDKPRPPELVVHDEAELARQLQIWEHGVEAWCLMKRYDPRKNDR
jgi:hypothetical protein